MSPEFSLPEFLSWCRTKPADERYCYTDSRTCALAQFAEATGRGHLAGPEGTNLLRRWDELEEAINPGAATYRAGRSLEHTFGALVKRLEKLCPETPDYARIEAYLVDLESVL